MKLWRSNNPGYTKAWNDANKQRIRANQLKINYGLTMKDYDIMVKAQNGLCAICQKPERFKTPLGNIRPLAVDHDHQTGEVRGLLCDRCNNGLGSFKDSPALLNRAQKYLVSL